MLTTLRNIHLRLLLTCSAILLLQVSPVEAQPRRTLAQLQQQIDTLTQLVNALVRRVDILEGSGTTQLPTCITTEGNDVVFNGCNVHIRDGSGDTRRDERTGESHYWLQRGRRPAEQPHGVA